MQLHVGHTAANAGEVLHDEGHVVLHLGNMIEQRMNLVTDRLDEHQDGKIQAD